MSRCSKMTAEMSSRQQSRVNAGSMHSHIIMIWLMILLLLDIRVITSWCWCDRTSRYLMVSFVLISIHEIFPIWCDWRCHVTIDHVAIRFLWCAREQVLILNMLLHNWLAWRCRRAGSSVNGLLVTEKVIQSRRDPGHVWRGVLSEKYLRWSIKHLGQLEYGLAHFTILILQHLTTTKNTTSQSYRSVSHDRRLF